MKNKVLNKTMAKIAAAVLSFILIPIMTSSAAVSADLKEPLILTKQKAVDTALKNNHMLIKLDYSYKSLNKQLDYAKDFSEKIDDALDALSEYASLYNKKKQVEESEEYKQKNEHKQELLLAIEKLKAQIDAAEEEDKPALQIKLEAKEEEKKKVEEEIEAMFPVGENAKLNALSSMFLTEFGMQSPNISKKDKFERFIKPRDFYWYSFFAAAQNLKIAKQSSQNMIKSGIKQLYNGVLAIQKGYEIQNNLLEVQKKEFKELEVKYDNGQVSKIQKDTAEIELKKLENAVNNFERNLQDMEYRLKQQMGIELSQEIVLQNKEYLKQSMPSFQSSLNRALENRAEIKAAKTDLDVKKREFEKTDEYISDDELEWMKADKDLYQAKANLDNTINDVKKDVTQKYNNMKEKKNTVDLTYKKLEQMKQNRDNLKIYYEQGLIQISKLWDIEIGCASAEVTYTNAVRDYNNAVEELDNASGIGNKYLPTGGK